MNDRIVIFDNGVALISTRQSSNETTFNKTELDRLGEIFEEARFSGLAGNYTSRRGGYDLLSYTITYQGKTVHTEDMAIPPELEPVIEEMNTILTRGTSSAPPDSHLPDIRS